MQVLLAISVLCFLALIWVALSIARYVNASHRRNAGSDEMPSIVPHVRQQKQPEPDFSQALSTALGNMQPVAPISVAFSETILPETKIDAPLRTLSGEGINLESTAEPSVLPKAESPREIQVDPRAQFTAEPHSNPAADPRLSEFPQPLAVQTTSEPARAESAAEGRFFRPAQAVTQAASRNNAETDESYHAGVAARISQLQQRASELQQNVRDISSAKSWNMPPKPLRARTPAPALADAELRDAAINTLAAGKSAPAPHSTPSTSDTRCVVEAGTEASRKPPQPTRRGVSQRLDRVYAVNQDAGDLSDPYQIPRAGINSGMTTTKQARS